MNQEQIAAEIYRFVKASKSLDDDQPALLLLLRKFAAAPAAPAAAAAADVPQAKKAAAERLLEAVEISGNAALRYDVDWSALDAQAAHFLDNNW